MDISKNFPDRTCMNCRTATAWLDSPYCYRCYLEKTKTKTYSNFSSINQNYEYIVQEQMLSRGYSKPKKKTPKVKKRTKQKQGIPAHKILIFEPLEYQLIPYAKSTRKSTVPPTAINKFIQYTDNDKKKNIPCWVDEATKTVYISTPNYISHGEILNPYFK